MKKLTILLLGFFLLAPSTLATNILSNYGTDLNKEHIQSLAAVLIEADADAEIKAEHGINILLSKTDWILWENAAISVSGTAVTKGRVAANVIAEYSPDYKNLHIPVQADFLKDEWLKIELLKVRTYDQDFGSRYLELDINGDLVADAIDVNGYRVEDIDDTDNTHPYPIYNLTHTLNDKGHVTLNWLNPPDYDVADIRVDKWVTTNGMTSYKPKVFSDYATTYTDTNLSGVDQVKYEIIATDYVGFTSEPVQLVVDLKAPIQVPNQPEETVDTPAEPEESTPVDTLKDELLSLYNYYKLRYSIKCKPGGVAVAAADSPCLWARIDLVYAQEITGKSEINTSLSARDLELMASRRQWPEMRYQDNCVDQPGEEADYCASLGKALDRISYFLD